MSGQIITTALAAAAARLGDAGIQPAAREARWLLEHVLDGDRSWQHEPSARLTGEQARALDALVAQRSTRYPLQYLLGAVEFAGLTLRVTPAVLIPRPETEEMVELVLEHVAARDAALECVDLGTGSGCLAIALANALPRSQWYACDISDAALDVARGNAEQNGLAARISFRQGSWWAALPQGHEFDLVVANPPYVEEGARLEPELAHEPAAALYAGRTGMDAYRAIAAELDVHLAPRGMFFGELDAAHAEDTRALLAHHTRRAVTLHTDLSGRARFVSAGCPPCG